MNNIHLIFKVLSAILIAILSVYLSSLARQKSASSYSGSHELRPSIFYTIFGILVCAATLFISIFLGYKFGFDDTWVFLGAMLMGFSLELPLLITGLNYKIRFTDDYVEETTLFGKARLVKWNEIRSAQFNKLSKCLVIRSASSKKRVYQFLSGFDELVRLLKQRSDDSVDLKLF